MGIELSRFADALEISYNTVHATPRGIALQEVLAPFANVLAMGMQTFASDESRVRLWLRLPQSQLSGNSTILDALLIPGQARAVENFVANACLGIPD